MKKLIVKKKSGGKRLDQFLTDHFDDLSRNQISINISTGKILVNSKKAKPGYKIKTGDKISIINIKQNKEVKLEAENIPLEIIFEDKDVVVINKPAGMVVHPGDKNKSGTLVNALIGYYPKIVEAVYDADSDISRSRPGIVHRLDKNTSGIMIVAKNKEALVFLSDQIKSRNAKKTYIALCLDQFIASSGDIRNKLIRHPKNRKQMTVSKDEKGKEAITKYKILETYKFNGHNISKVKFNILTGRTHQIRVHAKYLNSPILGDDFYFTKTSNKVSKELNLNRPMLHSCSLKIKLPSNSIKTFSAELPSDMSNLTSKLS